MINSSDDFFPFFRDIQKFIFEMCQLKSFIDVIDGLLSWVNPDFMAKLWTDPLGVKLLMASLVLAGVGIVWMRSLVSVRV